MIRIAQDMQLDYPAEAVFDLLANVEQEALWNPSAIRVKQIAGDGVGPGARFSGEYKGMGTLVTDLTTYERPRRLGFHSAGRHFDFDFLFTFEPRPGGTIVHTIADVQPHGLLRFLQPLLGPLLRREFRKRPAQIVRGLQPRAVTSP